MKSLQLPRVCKFLERVELEKHEYNRVFPFNCRLLRSEFCSSVRWRATTFRGQFAEANSARNFIGGNNERHLCSVNRREWKKLFCQIARPRYSSTVPVCETRRSKGNVFLESTRYNPKWRYFHIVIRSQFGHREFEESCRA